MSITSPIVVDDASGDDVTFSRQGGDSSSSRFVDLASLPGLPRLIEIRHQVTGAAGARVDRHVISLKETLQTSPTLVQLTVNFSIAASQNSLVTSQKVIDACANVIDFVSAGGLATLTTTNIEAVLRGET